MSSRLRFGIQVTIRPRLIAKRGRGSKSQHVRMNTSSRASNLPWELCLRWESLTTYDIFNPHCITRQGSCCGQTRQGRVSVRPRGPIRDTSSRDCATSAVSHKLSTQSETCMAQSCEAWCDRGRDSTARHGLRHRRHDLFRDTGGVSPFHSTEQGHLHRYEWSFTI